jgi:hypothetical protein
MHTSHVLYSSVSSDPPKISGDCWSLLYLYVRVLKWSLHPPGFIHVLDIYLIKIQFFILLRDLHCSVMVVRNLSTLVRNRNWLYLLHYPCPKEYMELLNKWLITGLILVRFAHCLYRHLHQQELQVRCAIPWLSFPQQRSVRHVDWLWQTSCWTTLPGYRAQWHSCQVQIALNSIHLQSRHGGIQCSLNSTEIGHGLNDQGSVSDRHGNFFYHQIQTDSGIHKASNPEDCHGIWWEGGWIPNTQPSPYSFLIRGIS